MLRQLISKIFNYITTSKEELRNQKRFNRLEALKHQPFPKIQRLENLEVEITEKLDGTNAVIYKHTNENGHIRLRFGSRNRWVSASDDNMGFYKFCIDNIQFIKCLPDGWHYGEFIGPKIQRGYGLKEKYLYLFDTRLQEMTVSGTLGPFIKHVPVLGLCILNTIDIIHTWGQPRMSMINDKYPMEGVMLFIPKLNQRIKVIFNKHNTVNSKNDE